MTVDRLADTAALRAADPRGRDGFEELVLASADRLHRSAVLMCGDHHLAEDLVQMTFAKAYAHWGKVSSADQPVAYLHTILTRTFLSQRRLRRSGERPVDSFPDTPASGQDPTVRIDLLTALRQLSPADRAVLVLRYWEDLSVARTAAVLGIREGTCRTRAARALERLRVLLPTLDTTSEDPS